jgi:hypothetical protein
MTAGDVGGDFVDNPVHVDLPSFVGLVMRYGVGAMEANLTRPNHLLTRW